MTYLTYNVKEYFQSVTDLNGKSVLDWGCNHANFLKFSDHACYTGVDVISEILESNKKQWPMHTWIHYDKFNPQYNCDMETSGSWPELQKYDAILAFSVFTHTGQDEMIDTIAKLKNHLNPGGHIYVTFFSLNSSSSFAKVVSYRKDLFGDIEHIYDGVCRDDTISLCASQKSSMMFKNMDTLPRIEKEMYTLTFYRDDHIENILGGKIVAPHKFTGIRGVQKCIKI